MDFQCYEFPVSGVVSFKELASKMNQEVNTEVVFLEKISPDTSLCHRPDKFRFIEFARRQKSV